MLLNIGVKAVWYGGVEVTLTLIFNIFFVNITKQEVNWRNVHIIKCCDFSESSAPIHPPFASERHFTYIIFTAFSYVYLTHGITKAKFRSTWNELLIIVPIMQYVKKMWKCRIYATVEWCYLRCCTFLFKVNSYLTKQILLRGRTRWDYDFFLFRMYEISRPHLFGKIHTKRNLPYSMVKRFQNNSFVYAVSRTRKNCGYL